jgi:hypothetical protein
VVGLGPARRFVAGECCPARSGNVVGSVRKVAAGADKFVSPEERRAPRNLSPFTRLFVDFTLDLRFRIEKTASGSTVYLPTLNRNGNLREELA